MTAIARVNMHDNNMAASIHGVALPSFQPTLNMKTNPTSIFRRSFEALAKASSPDNDSNVDEDSDEDDDDEDDDGEEEEEDDFDICDANTLNSVANMNGSNRTGHFYDHHINAYAGSIKSDLGNATGTNIHPCSVIAPVRPGLEMIGPGLGSIVGDDDFSDHDSHYSADFEEDDDFIVPYPSLMASFPRQAQLPNVAKQLLDFAETINGDIKKFFGRKPGEEDSCDIYEDKWVSSKSGRELYYADLLRIAHGEGIETKCKSSKNSSLSSPYQISPSTSSERRKSITPTPDNKEQFSGKLNKAFGLGPLNELFEYGLRGFLPPVKKTTQTSSGKKFKRLKIDLKKRDDVVPMNKRKLPDSFWKQPGCIVSTSGLKSKLHPQSSSNNVDNLINSKTLDFSDLLESWTGEERPQFNSDVSCSDVSTSSSE